MRQNQIDLIRRFNRAITQGIGALDDVPIWWALSGIVATAVAPESFICSGLIIGVAALDIYLR